jgi:hypothetical protein
MSLRQTAQDLFLRHGYLSKNVLARHLSISLSEAGPLIESLLSTPGAIGLYTLAAGDCITLTSKPLPGARIYAASLEARLSHAYEIECGQRRLFYNDQVVYPPADSGHFPQAQRIVHQVAKTTPTTVVKSAFRKTGTEQAMEIVQKGGKEDGKHAGEVKVEAEMSKLNIAQGEKLVEKEKKTDEKEKKTNTGVLVNGGKNSKQKTLSFKPPDVKVSQVCKEVIEMDIDCKPVEKSVHVEEAPSETAVETPTKPHSVVWRKPTPHPSKAVPKTQNFDELTANRSIYDMEEEDSSEKPASPIDKEKENNTKSLKRKASKHPPEKRAKYANSNSNVMLQPFVTKRKVTKSRQFYENGKLITEDYTSEEEVVIERTITPAVKKPEVQRSILFYQKPRVDIN